MTYRIRRPINPLRPGFEPAPAPPRWPVVAVAIVILLITAYAGTRP